MTPTPTAGHPQGADSIIPNPGDARSYDRFAYGLNNPLRYVDPTGHYSKEALMKHFDCPDIDCVLSQFGEGGAYAGLWGWFHILTQAEDGDQIDAHSIGLGFDGKTQWDNVLHGTFATVNGKIMLG